MISPFIYLFGAPKPVSIRSMTPPKLSDRCGAASPPQFQLSRSIVEKESLFLVSGQMSTSHTGDVRDLAEGLPLVFDAEQSTLNHSQRYSSGEPCERAVPKAYSAEWALSLVAPNLPMLSTH